MIICSYSKSPTLFLWWPRCRTKIYLGQNKPWSEWHNVYMFVVEWRFWPRDKYSSLYGCQFPPKKLWVDSVTTSNSKPLMQQFHQKLDRRACLMPILTQPYPTVPCFIVSSRAMPCRTSPVPSSRKCSTINSSNSYGKWARLPHSPQLQKHPLLLRLVSPRSLRCSRNITNYTPCRRHPHSPH